MEAEHLFLFHLLNEHPVSSDYLSGNSTAVVSLVGEGERGSVYTPPNVAPAQPFLDFQPGTAKYMGRIANIPIAFYIRHRLGDTVSHHFFIGTLRGITILAFS